MVGLYFTPHVLYKELALFPRPSLYLARSTAPSIASLLAIIARCYSTEFYASPPTLTYLRSVVPAPNLPTQVLFAVYIIH